MVKRVFVYGIEYKVVKDKTIEKKGLAGDVNFKKKIIRIADGEMSTLIHEIFHATLYEMNFAQVLEDDIEELLVENLSQVVAKNFTLKVKNGKRRS